MAIKKQQKQFKELTAGEIKEIALNRLNYEYNAEAWLQNNIAVRGRKFNGKKGVGDIIGFLRYNGIMVQCEAKTLTDKLRVDQIDLLTQLHNAGGVALVAYQEGPQVQIKTIVQFLNRKQ